MASLRKSEMGYGLGAAGVRDALDRPDGGIGGVM